MLSALCPLINYFLICSSKFSGIRFSSELINAVCSFKGFKLRRGKDKNLDTKNLALFQNLNFLLTDFLTKPSLSTFIVSNKLPITGSILNWDQMQNSLMWDHLVAGVFLV